MLRKESFAGRPVEAIQAILLFLTLAAGSSTAFATFSAKPSDPLACNASLIHTVAEASHINEPDSDLSACRRDPTSPDHRIVAMFVPVSPEAGHDDESPYDLNLVIWNTKTARPVASYKKAKAIEVNAPIRGSASIDTARYNLADGVRAFGLRTNQYTSCGGCTYSETKLALYVRDGNTLRPVLTTQVSHTGDGFKKNA
jgi:hypothetical protein